MSLGLDEINSFSDVEFEAVMQLVCASANFAKNLNAKRPFSATAELLNHARDVFSKLSREDMTAAFDARLLIGCSNVVEEESTATTDDTEIYKEIQDKRRAYADKFGFVCVTTAVGGDTPGQLREQLDEMEERLCTVDAEREFERNRAAEYTIVRRRLCKLAYDGRDAFDLRQPQRVHLVPSLMKPLPHYDFAVSHSGFVFLSGIQGFIPGTLQLPSDSPGEQARNVITNMQTVLEVWCNVPGVIYARVVASTIEQAAGSKLDKVVKLTIIMRDMSDFAEINAHVTSAWKTKPPARTSIQVSSPALTTSDSIAGCVAKEL